MLTKQPELVAQAEGMKFFEYHDDHFRLSINISIGSGRVGMAEWIQRVRGFLDESAERLADIEAESAPLEDESAGMFAEYRRMVGV